MTVRLHRRDVTVGDLDVKELNQALKDTGMTRDEADAIFRLTSLPLFDQRFVIPAAHREESMEMLESTADVKGNTGFGFKETPARGL